MDIKIASVTGEERRDRVGGDTDTMYLKEEEKEMSLHDLHVRYTNNVKIMYREVNLK